MTEEFKERIKKAQNEEELDILTKEAYEIDGVERYDALSMIASRHWEIYGY